MFKSSHFKSFHYLENGEVNYSNFETIKSIEFLETGTYLLKWLDYPANRVQINKIELKENLLMFNWRNKEIIDKVINGYFEYKKVSELGLIHKLGVLFYGQEGTGKSSIIKRYCKQLIDTSNALVFYIEYSEHHLKDIWDFVVQLRQSHINPFVIVMDEIDVFASKEALLKAILDGHLSIDNSIFFGSTNYIDLIPDAIKKRPSRFKYTIEIGGINSEQEIFEIITNTFKNIFKEQDVKNYAIELRGKTIDEIKHFCIDKMFEFDQINKGKRRIGFF